MNEDLNKILSATDPRLEPLCPSIKRIMLAEITLGNAIVGIQEGGWSKIDLSVSLKRPFIGNYENAPEVSFYRNEDPHYPLNDSYCSPQHRQAIDAPHKKAFFGLF